MSIEVRFTFNAGVLADAVGAAEDAAEAMAEDVLKRSQGVVPVQTGKLKQSGRVAKRSDGSAAVVYGGAGVSYAAAVHARPGKRFLRDPAMDTRKLGKAVAEAYRRRLR